MFIGARSSEGNITSSKQTGASEITWPWLYALSRMGIRVLFLIMIVIIMPWAGRLLGPFVLAFGAFFLREKAYIRPKLESKKLKVVMLAMWQRITHWVFERETYVPDALAFIFPDKDEAKRWMSVLVIMIVGAILTFMATMNWWPAWEWVMWSDKAAERFGPMLPALPFDREPGFGDMLLVKDMRRVDVKLLGMIVYQREPYVRVTWQVGMDHAIRWLIVLGLPLCMAVPLLLLDWVFKTESVFTNFRSIVFGKADAAGVALPSGQRIKSLTGQMIEVDAVMPEKPRLMSNDAGGGGMNF